MNDTRRKKIKEIYEKIEDIKSDIEEVLDEEQNALDNMPESFEGTERYAIAENAVENLDSAIMELDEALEYLGEAKSQMYSFSVGSFFKQKNKDYQNGLTIFVKYYIIDLMDLKLSPQQADRRQSACLPVNRAFTVLRDVQAYSSTIILEFSLFVNTPVSVFA